MTTMTDRESEAIVLATHDRPPLTAAERAWLADFRQRHRHELAARHARRQHAGWRTHVRARRLLTGGAMAVTAVLLLIAWLTVLA